MSIRKGLSITALIAALAIASVAFRLSLEDSGPFQGSGITGGAQRGSSPNSTFDLESARAISEFPVYDAGEEVRGQPLVAILRREDTADYVSFIYGTCEAESDSGCLPPAEVQNWPACKRNLSLYGANTPGTPVPEPTTIRGVPAAFFDGSTRLEIQTGRGTIVIFAASKDELIDIADALTGVNVPVERGATLPPPVRGAVGGKLSC